MPCPVRRCCKRLGALDSSGASRRRHHTQVLRNMQASSKLKYKGSMYAVHRLVRQSIAASQIALRRMRNRREPASTNFTNACLLGFAAGPRHLWYHCHREDGGGGEGAHGRLPRAQSHKVLLRCLRPVRMPQFSWFRRKRENPKLNSLFTRPRHSLSARNTGARRRRWARSPATWPAPAGAAGSSSGRRTKPR